VPLKHRWWAISTLIQDNIRLARPPLPDRFQVKPVAAGISEFQPHGAAPVPRQTLLDFRLENRIVLASFR